MLQAKQIAECTGLPLPYLSKILHSLGRSGLVLTKRGYNGGFTLARPAEQITLVDVAEAVDGAGWLPQCLLGLDDCPGACHCPTRTFWKKERQRIEAELRRITVRDLLRLGRRGTSSHLDQACAVAGRRFTTSPKGVTSRSANKRRRGSKKRTASNSRGDPA